MNFLELKTPDMMYDYQILTANRIIDNGITLKHGGFGALPLLEMGLGKTVSTLTAIAELRRRGEITAALVIAPKKVVENVWKQECEGWTHLNHLKTSLVTGNEKQRLVALKTVSDVYCIGRDNVEWLEGQLNGKKWPFDMLVIDEISSFKNQDSKRWKSLRRMVPRFYRRVGLTGTLRPNGLQDVWPQMYLVDRGERLGEKVTEFRRRYLVPDKRNGDQIFSYKVRGNKDELLGAPNFYEDDIIRRISDISFSMRAEDYLQLPPFMDQIVPVTLPAKVLRAYQQFEAEMVLSLPDEDQITAVNAATLTGKLLQYASGAIYTPEKAYIEVHDAKIAAFIEDMEAADGDPVLCFYWFQHTRDRILQQAAHYKPRVLATPEDISDWNAGKIKLGLLHPQSGGHGLNLQYGGRRMAWMDMFWSCELYLQARARVMRQGQTRPVISRRYVAVDTVDMDAVNTLDSREAANTAMMKALKARVEKYTK